MAAWRLILVRAAAVACVTGVIAALACGGSSIGGPNGPPFPFSGPSCSGADFNQNCWDCIEEEGGPSSCFTSQCSAYFTCFCACQATDTTCQSSCKQSPACATCLQGVIEYERTTCGTLCRGIGTDDAGDATSEGASETGSEAGPETGPGPEPSPEPGPEAGPETAPEAGPETGSEAASDTGTGGG